MAFMREADPSVTRARSMATVKLPAQCCAVKIPGTGEAGNLSRSPRIGAFLGRSIGHNAALKPFHFMKLRLLALSLAAAVVTALAQAPAPQNPPANGNNNPNGNNQRVNDAENRTGFWDCTVPGGNFTIALGKIASVSIHEFMVTGGRVVEVNVDTEGSVCARFYFMEPMAAGSSLSATQVVKDRLTELADTAAERTGTDKVWRKVQKDYPLATHAHTVDFRLQSREDLAAIHSSAKGAWMTGRGRSIRIVDAQ